MKKILNLKNQLKEINHLFRIPNLFLNGLDYKLKLLMFVAVFTICSQVIFVEAQEFEEYGVKVETVAENLEIPWSIAFAPDGRIFFTERVGSLRVIEGGDGRRIAGGGGIDIDPRLTAAGI